MAVVALIDVTGQIFGLLTVLERAPSSSSQARWRCRCACGRIITAYGHPLRSGRSQSCGCRVSDLATQRATTHGLSGGPEWLAWRSMRVRCTSPRDDSYSSYGGRGITVCEKWDSFEAFYADMG